MKNYDDRGSCFALSESYKASQNNALVRKPNSFIFVVKLTNQTIPTFSGIFVLILNKRLLITSIIRSSQRG